MHQLFCLSWLRIGALATGLAALPAASVRAQAAGQALPVSLVLRTYQGEYKGGRTTYTYYLNAEGERVRHGRFEQTRKTEGAVSFGSLRQGMRQMATTGASGYHFEYRLAGSYTHDLRTGRWDSTITTISTYGSVRDSAMLIDKRLTYSQLYRAGQPDGPASYSEVPWHAGKPGLPDEAANANRHRQRTTYQTQDTQFGQAVEGSARDTILGSLDYAAGPFRYEANPSLSDPSHRRQSVRGRFNAAGYCDSTWTLHYWKSGSEGDEDMYGREFSDVEKAGGWFTTTLDFSHGLLRREQTVQQSTGHVLHRFVQPAPGPVSRLRLATTAAHLYDFQPGDNNRPETPDPDWNSPLPKEEDASHYFFREALAPLGPPRLLNAQYQLAPTAADSALLDHCVVALNQATTQWKAARDTAADSRLRALSQQLYNALAATHPLRPSTNATEPELDDLSDALAGRGQSRASAVSGTRENPYPWLTELASAENPSSEQEQLLLHHLTVLTQRLAAVQASLGSSQGATPSTP